MLLTCWAYSGQCCLSITQRGLGIRETGFHSQLGTLDVRWLEMQVASINDMSTGPSLHSRTCLSGTAEAIYPLGINQLLVPSPVLKLTGFVEKATFQVLSTQAAVNCEVTTGIQPECRTLPSAAHANSRLLPRPMVLFLMAAATAFQTTKHIILQRCFYLFHRI